MRASGMDLVNAVNDLTLELSASVRLLEEYGYKLAMEEQAYRIKRMEETLRLREQGMPVSIIDTVAKGKCAKEQFKMNVAETLYKTTQEKINSIKLQLRIAEAQIDREWTNG